MADRQLAYWLVACCLALLPLLASSTVARWLRGERFQRLVTWARDRFDQVEEPDEEADELRRLLRRDRLVANLQRVQRLVSHDDFMSATRQIGNRMAYEQLQRDLRECLNAAPSWATDGVGGRWDTVPPPMSWSTPTGPYRQQAPTVETLDIGWRR